MVTSHYDVLGVPTTADRATIRAAYRRLARQTHPDLGGDAADFAAVALAWSVLADPAARALHDAELAGDDGTGWGEELGLDEPVPTPGPQPGPGPAPDGGAPDTDEVAPGDTPPRHGPVDPFSSPPLVLPLPDTTSVARYYPRPVGGWTFLAYGTATLGALIVVGAFPDRAPISSAALAGLAAYSLLLVAVVTLRTISAGRASGKVSAALLYGVVLVFGLGGNEWIADSLTDEVRTTRVVIVALGVVASLGVAAVFEVRRSRARRVVGELLRIYDVGAAARRWNLLLHELDRTPGAVLVDGALVPPARRRPEPGWAVVDAAGVTYAVATEADREAWCATLRASGVDVAATTGPGTGSGATAGAWTPTAPGTRTPELKDPQQRVAQVARRLTDAGYSVRPVVEIGDELALLGHTSQFRWRWMATRLHLMVYVQAVDTVTIDRLERFSHGCLEHALAAKGTRLGFHVLAVAPVLVGARVEPGAASYAQHQIVRRFGAFAWPVAVDATSGAVSRHAGRPYIGAAFTPWLRRQLDAATAGT